MTLTQQILSAAVGHPVKAGDVVVAEVDRIMAHDGSTPVVARTLAKHGLHELAAADRAVVVFDHYYPATTQAEADLQAVAREFADRYGIPVYAGRGISHQLLPELGLVSPGKVLVGGDSHTCTEGAFGSFATGLGATDVAAVLATGRLWLEVPEVLTIRLEGRVRTGVSFHDAVLHVIGLVGVQGALGRAIEFVGPGIADLSIADRMKLCNHAVEMGAVAGLIGVDGTSERWLAARGADLGAVGLALHDPVGAAADLNVDLGAVDEMLALPSKPDNVLPLAQARVPSRVDQVFIGSCAGGRLEDLQQAAGELEGTTVAPGMRLLIAPASAEVQEQAMADGTLGSLLKAGAVLLPPGCGACLGRVGTLRDGDVAVTTQNRNFVGRAGSSQSELYLASPAAAARVARDGRIPGEGGSAR
ncbi:aconitase/3-isopropylmalate dehydratase large subunit family protein [Kitasatospora phosalacinea]|uniref:aconitase/3-isopropylmalate dehydratase large subunit family protein n=1 Tax=Kitasatospora phosalacinea TaxID=2065 RepID=UPI003662F3C7